MKVHTLAETPPWDWPADAHDEILAVLRNQEAPTPDRLLAVQLAGDLVVLNDVLAQEVDLFHPDGDFGLDLGVNVLGRPAALPTSE